MSGAELWDVRLPDGRTLRSQAMQTVLEHLRSGRLQTGTLVRRPGEEDWIGIEWIPEFALALAEGNQARANSTHPRPTQTRREPVDPDYHGATVADRLEGDRLGVLGALTILREVVTALDLALMSLKLRLISILGLLGGLLFVVPSLCAWQPEGLFWGQTAVALLLVALGGILVGQLVCVEVSRNRPGRWREARKGLLGQTVRFALGLFVMPGIGVALLVGLLRYLNGFETPGEEVGSWLTAGACLALVLPLVVFGPTTLMLAPILVVEECGVFRALIQWYQLLRANLGKALLYDLLGTGVILLFLLAPAALVMSLSWLPLPAPFHPLVQAVQGILAGLLVALALVYLLVVQVFLYLNLRFDSAD